MKPRQVLVSPKFSLNTERTTMEQQESQSKYSAYIKISFAEGIFFGILAGLLIHSWAAIPVAIFALLASFGILCMFGSSSNT